MALALVPIKQLDGPRGYLRWKESMLLRIHSLGWARDDAVCRGHILATLSDRLLPDYARFATAAELWRALARTYDVEASRRVRLDEFHAFQFDEATGGVLLEQIAHAEALGAAARLDDDYVADSLCGKLPELVGTAVIVRSGSGPGDDEMGMGLVWDVARRLVASGIGPEDLWKTTMVDNEGQEGGYF
ncbi:unnamed protein product [Urochloa decumbens]|uniref:Uncharacterized protein n=1 Tax=Urochloa decumbens TaxID=240449 RepID=A0ABC9BIG5_9POAL